MRLWIVVRLYLSDKGEEMTNWAAFQVPRDKDNGSIPLAPHGIKPKYLVGGVFHASKQRGGASVKPYKITGTATPKG